MSLEPIDIQLGYIKFYTFSWCQVRQAFAEELYSAYQNSKDGEVGTKDWFDAYKEGQLIADRLKSTYQDQNRPMFLGANPDEINWDSMWCFAWWYSNQSATNRSSILSHIGTSPYSLDIDPVLQIDNTLVTWCRERAFLDEKKHSSEPNCVPLPRDSASKIIAFLGGMSLGIVGLGIAYLLAKSNRVS